MVPLGHNTSSIQSDYQLKAGNSSTTTTVAQSNNTQRGIMKSPSRMRYAGSKLKSSARSNQSELRFAEFRSSTSTPSGSPLLVSARYTRRRASCAVTFGLAEDSSPAENDSETVDDYERARTVKDFYRRRMSAPELPPISTVGNSSGALINNANLTTRSKTFHNYKFNKQNNVINNNNNNIYQKNRNSIHSDSSGFGYGNPTTTSRTSSSSSHASRGRVLSAGADKGTHKQFTPESIKENTCTAGTVKLESLTMRNGMTSVVPARSPSVTGFRRSNTKISLGSTTVSTPRTLVHNKSESQLHLRNTKTKRQQSSQNTTGLKRIGSEQKLSETKKNAKNSQINGYKEPGVGRTRNYSGTVGGMRRYSSNLGLNSINGRRSDEEEERPGNADSDSDTENSRRVLDWLIGTDAEELDPPEEPVIEYNEDPPQRDTAIRIVYGGDAVASSS